MAVVKVASLRVGLVWCGALLMWCGVVWYEPYLELSVTCLKVDAQFGQLPPQVRDGGHGGRLLQQANIGGGREGGIAHDKETLGGRGGG